MAVVFLTEFRMLGREDHGGAGTIIQTPLEPPIRDQQVAIGSSSVQSDVLNAETRVVRVHTDAICHIDVGTNPTAGTTKRRLPANAIEYIAIPPGTQFRVAVITGS